MISIFDSSTESQSHSSQNAPTFVPYIQSNLLSSVPLNETILFIEIRFQLNDCFVRNKCLNSRDFSIYVQKKLHVQFVFSDDTLAPRIMFMFTESVIAILFVHFEWITILRSVFDHLNKIEYWYQLSSSTCF